MSNIPQSPLLNQPNISNVLQSPIVQSFHPSLQQGRIQGFNQTAPQLMPQYAQPAMQQPALQPMQPIGPLVGQLGFSQGGQTVGIPDAQPVMQSLSKSLSQSLPEGLLSPDAKTQLSMIASNPIANIGQVPSVFTKLTKDVEKQLLVTVLERFKTILELFKQPASDAVNALLKKELDTLTENMNDPSLRPIVDTLSRAAEIPIQRFLDNLTDIIQRHFPALVGKFFNTAGNVIGEIPVVGIFVNAALAFSNVLNTIRTTTDMVDRTSMQFQSLHGELTNSLNNLVNDTQAHVGHALGPISIMKKNATEMSGVGLKGGSTSRGGRKMHTLKRIHNSIKQFIHTNKRTLKHSYKKPRRH